MKNLKKNTLKRYANFMLLIALIIFCNPSKAQVSVNLNISSQAAWGPVGYDYVDYYYLPEADVFYYVPTGQFIYWNGDQEVFASTLPPSYNINLYNTYKVVVNEPKPYRNHGYYVSNYAKYKSGGPKQRIIRDSDDERYYSVKGHPKYGHKNDNGNNNGGKRENSSMGNNRSVDNKPSNMERRGENRQQSQPSNQQHQAERQHPNQQHQEERQRPNQQRENGGGGGHNWKGH
jgi:hypothetical protein